MKSRFRVAHANWTRGCSASYQGVYRGEEEFT